MAVIMDADRIARSLARMAHEILERNRGVEDLAFVGIRAGVVPIAARLAKEAVRKGCDLTLDQGIRLEEDLYALLQTTADRAEGVRAFLDKRKPLFRGA